MKQLERGEITNISITPGHDEKTPLKGWVMLNDDPTKVFRVELCRVQDDQLAVMTRTRKGALRFSGYHIPASRLAEYMVPPIS